jgi:hypothetical protein
MAKSEKERLESKIIRDLRKRLIKAENENRRLRKQLHVLEAVATLSPFDADEEKLLEKEEKKIYKAVDPDGFLCPKCKESCNNVFVLRGIEYFRCQCGKKGRTK